MKNFVLRSPVAPSCALLLAGFVALPAQAQDNARPLAIEEIIVTAQKRAENLQEAPISIAAFNDRQLANLGVTDLSVIQHNVPSLSMRQFPNAKGTLRIFIRGIGNNDAQLSQDPGVGVYVDGVYMARSSGLASELADLERIEVLRGPQGTLYGRNTTGGAINIITRKPAGELRFKQQFSVGNRDYWRSATTLDLPRFAELALQLNYHAGASDGPVRNIGGGNDFGDDDRRAYRLAARWTPLPPLTLDYVYDHSRIDSGAPYYQTLAEPFPGFGAAPWSDRRIERTASSVPLQDSELEISGHSLALSWELGEHSQLKWLSAYRELDEFTYQDYGASAATPRLFANDPFTVDQEQWSHELQWVGSVGAFEYVAGLYYFHEEGDEYSIDRISLPMGPGFSLIELPLQSRASTVESSARAIFGQLTWTPPTLPRLHLTAGLRRTEDRRELAVDRFQALDGNVFNTDADKTFSRTSPAFTVAYDFSDTVNGYLRWAEGYRSGAFNSRADSVTAATQPVDAEIVRTVEAGLKSEWWDRRLRLNAAVFASDFDDIQLGFTLPDNPSAPVFFNAGQASIDGAEIDLTWLMAEGLLLNVGYGFIDANVDKVIDPVTGVDASSEYEMASAPRHSYTVDLDYTFPDFGFGVLSANLNYAWRDDQRVIFNLGGPLSGQPRNEPYNELESYGLWNARLTLSEIPVGGGGFEVSLWGKNLADKEYLLDGVVNFPWSPKVGLFGDPRSYGMDVVYRWE